MTVDTVDENGHKVTLDSISRDDADKFHKEHQATFPGSLASDLNILKSERANDVPSGIAELKRFIHQESSVPRRTRSFSSPSSIIGRGAKMLVTRRDQVTRGRLLT